MKILIITAVSAFVITIGITMALTGTFRHIASRFSEPAETQQATETGETQSGSSEPAETEQAAVTGKAQEEGESLQPQEDGDLGSPSARKRNSAILALGDPRLADYEAQIAVAEAKLAAIKAEIESLNNVKTSITRSQQLAKVYGSMRPNNAASILCELEEALTGQILSEMNNRTAGKMMDAIATANPTYAAKLSKFMADLGAER